MNLVGELCYHLGDGCARLRFSESRTSLSIDTVLVPSTHRGLGIGSALIARVLLLADATGRAVHVSARPLGNASEETLLRLVTFYERFGFVEHDRGLTVVHLRRQPSTGVTPPLIP